jgi:hypothetical protein
MGSTYEGKNREVIICSEVLDDEYLAITAKEYKKCSDSNEKPQNTNKLSRTIIARHGQRKRIIDAQGSG